MKPRLLFFLTLVLLLFFLIPQAQTSHSRRKEDFDVHEFDAQAIDIATGTCLLQLSNIQGITVMDARADTSAIGFMQKKIVDPVAGVLNNSTRNQTEQRINKRPTFIVAGAGLQQEATHYMEHALVFPGNGSLPGILMVIKKLWLSDELPVDKQLPANAGRFAGMASKDSWTSGIDVKIEFYLKDGKDYYPLYRYDSTISEAMTISEYGPEFVELALRLSVQKMKQMDAKMDAIRCRTKFSLEEINRHNKNDFNLPVLSDTLLKPGVYMTFEEFKNNNPSQTSFELSKDKLTDILFIKQPDGKEWVARNVWGYCNGANAFVKSGDNFFLLQRVENAYYIFGAKNIKRTESTYSTTGSYYPGTSVTVLPVYYTTSRTAIQLEPFQLDWSTGKLY